MKYTTTAMMHANMKNHHNALLYNQLLSIGYVALALTALAAWGLS